MYINIKKEMDFNDIAQECYNGANFTLERIAQEGKEENFINWLNNVYYSDVENIEQAPTFTELNDLLVHDEKYVLEQLGIDLVKKYDIDELDSEPYYRALENYLNDFAEYDKEGEKLRRWLWENVGSSATEWSLAVIRQLEEAINENGIEFDADGNIINE